jgi:LysM repeat protein
MLKKIWEKYSYVIVLVAVCFIAAIAISNRFEKSDEFMNVTVNKGETLWEIAEKFSDQHTMSSAEFVHWVEEENGISGDKIFPGDSLMIPVQNNQQSTEVVTVLAGE